MVLTKAPAKSRLFTKPRCSNWIYQKAALELGWKPVLNFEETVQLTATGYLAEKDITNVYNQRLSQIKEYSSKALERKNAWISA